MSLPDEPSSKPPCLRSDALAVLRRLREQGHVAYFAGGCVRDLALGLDPKDYDVATDAPPKRVRQLFSNTQAVGQAFGVILVKHGKSTVEVATFRTDASYSDGRRPDAVTFSTPAEDARRRDFTINGLFLDPLPELPVASCQSPGGSAAAAVPVSTQGAALGTQHSAPVRLETPHGEVIDYVGGLEDLRGKTLRAIGDPHHRFAEDHLRLLRAVRFAARFGLHVEPVTADAIRSNAPRLRGISPERVADELRAMLSPPTRAQAWPMLWAFALIDVVFRFVPIRPGTDQEAVEFDPTRSLFLNLAPGERIPFGLALAAGALDYRLQSAPAAIDPVPLASRQEIARTGRALRDALKISNDELTELEGTLAPLPALLAAQEPGIAAKKRLLARPTAPRTRALLEALARLGAHRERIAALQQEFDELLKGDVAPPPLVTGDDLTAAGYKPGPAFKLILDAVYDAQLEGRVTTKEDGLALAAHVAAQQPASASRRRGK